MKTIRIQLETLTCPSCINKIEGVLNKQNGVDEAKVMFNSSKVKITYNEEETNPWVFRSDGASDFGQTVPL